MKGRERSLSKGTARAGVGGVQEGEAVSTGNGAGQKLEADPTATTGAGAHVLAALLLPGERAQIRPSGQVP